MTLNAKLWRDSGSGHLKLEEIWMPKTDERNDSKCIKLENMALNAYEGKLWLWTPMGDLKAYNSNGSEHLNENNDFGWWAQGSKC